MQYMVVEHFKPGKKEEVYQRYDEKGRMLPEGLHYVMSWLEKDGDRCYQLMETENPELFQNWVEAWEDLVEFEIIPLQPSPTQGGTDA